MAILHKSGIFLCIICHFSPRFAVDFAQLVRYNLSSTEKQPQLCGGMEITMPKILTVSSANMDFVMKMPSVPKAGETLISPDTFSYVPGGKGANSAVAFARLGGESIFCTRLGCDANGDALFAIYNKEGINTDFISRDPASATGLAAILVEGSGANRIIVYPGANMTIEDHCIEKAISLDPDALYMQLEISKESVVCAANEAARRGIPVFIDAGPADPDFPFSKLPRLEVFSPNESETEILTGIFPESEESCAEAAKKLAALVDSHYYVIKLGGRGCYVTDLESSFTAPGFSVSAIDTTAAGDSFTAALTLEYLRTGDIRAAARFANAVGAIVVGRAGALPSIPTKAEVEHFLQSR